MEKSISLAMRCRAQCGGRLRSRLWHPAMETNSWHRLSPGSHARLAVNSPEPGNAGLARQIGRCLIGVLVELVTADGLWSTMLMSPRSTLNSCGNSSRPALRSTAPKRVTRVSAEVSKPKHSKARPRKPIRRWRAMIVRPEARNVATAQRHEERQHQPDRHCRQNDVDQPFDGATYRRDSLRTNSRVRDWFGNFRH